MVVQALQQAAYGRKIDWGLDILHTNTCQVLDRRIEGFCEKGDILLCIRNLNLVVVFDPVTRKIRWEHDGTGFLEHPHEPTLLDNGNVLIFDNGYKRKYSRVLEFDPMTLQTVWQYEAQPSHNFYSRARGSIQRFPNGNTLITESDSGRVFEVTEQGDIVWEWYNPIFSSNHPDRTGKRAIVYRMKRLELEFVAAMAR
jgi:outer membrane protein assembly factor BamB